jgi:hypothetical protein
MPAITLEDAYNVFDPLQPITRGQIETQFVERPLSPAHKMQADLSLTRKPIKMLFVGHRGSGKSSELTYLATRLEERFFAVNVPLFAIFGSPAVSHVEVIFAMTMRLLQAATDGKIVQTGIVNQTWQTLLEPIYQFFKTQLFGEQLIPADQKTEITLKLNMLAADLEARLGTESYTRDQVREKFAGRVREMLDKIADITLMLERDSPKKLLLIVEDLDKFDLENTRRLFLDHSGTLILPSPSVVYTFPVAMRYSNDFMQIRRTFDGVYQLPNISLNHRSGEMDVRGQRILHDIITHRADQRLFSDGVVEQAVQLCGGHVKTLIQSMRLAIRQAVVENERIIQKKHLDQAIAEVRDDYIALLKKDQVARLREWQKNASKILTDVTPETEDLLYNGSLLEYSNTLGPWAAVNPIVAEILEMGLV